MSVGALTRWEASDDSNVGLVEIGPDLDLQGEGHARAGTVDTDRTKIGYPVHMSITERLEWEVCTDNWATILGIGVSTCGVALANKGLGACRSRIFTSFRGASVSMNKEVE